MPTTAIGSLAPAISPLRSNSRRTAAGIGTFQLSFSSNVPARPATVGYSEDRRYRQTLAERLLQAISQPHRPERIHTHLEKALSRVGAARVAETQLAGNFFLQCFDENVFALERGGLAQATGKRWLFRRSGHRSRCPASMSSSSRLRRFAS